MAKLGNRTWARDFLIVPLIVGLVVAAVAFILPRLFQEKSELSYTIYRAERQLDNPAIQSARIEINGIRVSDLYAYKVRLWNSGTKTISGLSVSFVFENAQDSFQVISSNHATNPPYEFGEVTDSIISATHRRATYALLNLGDEDILTVLTTESADLAVFAKAEGLDLRRVTPEEGKKSRFLPWLAFLAASSSLLTMLLSSVLLWMRGRMTPALRIMRGILEEKNRRLQGVAELLFDDIEIAVGQMVKSRSFEKFVGRSRWNLRQEDHIDSHEVSQSVGKEVTSVSTFLTDLEGGPKVGTWYATRASDLVMDEGAFRAIDALYRAARRGVS